jgi:uncharacterized membrane protein
MKTGPVERSVEIAAPLKLVYNALARFEDLPQFVEGVEDVHLADETHLQWRMRVGGAVRDGGAEITEQRPWERIAWRADAGEVHDGCVTFERLDDARTRVTVRLELDRGGDGHDGRLRADLDRFKAVTEARSRGD